MSKTKSISAIAVFYIIAITFRYLAVKTNVFSGVENIYFQALIRGIGPTIGVLVVFLVFKFSPKMTFKGNYKNIFIPLLLFWGLPIFLITTLAYFTNKTFPFIPVLVILAYGMLEEIGWRGFLYQALKPLPKFTGILIITILWFAWHLNFELTASNLIFFGILLLGSWGIGLVADKTNSLLAVSAFHSLNNFFNELNIQKSIVLILLIAVWIFFIFLNKKKTVEV